MVAPVLNKEKDEKRQTGMLLVLTLAPWLSMVSYAVVLIHGVKL